MKHVIATFILTLFLFSSCDRVKSGAKNTINKGGEVVGKTATEFIEGVSEGIDETLDCKISLSEDLKKKGIKTGKFAINNDSLNGINNMLTVYLIFDNDFNGTITAKAFDKNGLEIGRKKMEAESNAGEAGYCDFVFDKRTQIEVRSKIILE